MASRGQAKSGRRSTLGPSVVELEFDKRSRSSVISLEKRTFLIRSDQVRNLRAFVLDLQLDDYNFSQTEVLRLALDQFLGLDLVEQIEALELHRLSEKAAGVGIGCVRPG